MSCVFCFLQECLFGEYDGCESGDGGCGWCCSVGVVGVICGVGMGVENGCVGARGKGVVSSGGSVSVADGRGNEWRDCCRFPKGISGELQEDLPNRLPFTLNISDVILKVCQERRDG